MFKLTEASKVNDRIKQHSRMVYPPQSQRHVAEQIESLHWTLASAATDAASDRDAVVATRDLDLTDSSVLANLPEDYDDLHLHERRDGGEDNADGEGEEEAERYLRLRGELLALSEKRDTLMTKLARYQHLCRLLAPLDEPQTNVQPNLVTRDGELAQELDRMRVLLARVTGKVAGTQDLTRVGHQSPHAMAQTDQQKLAHVLALT